MMVKKKILVTGATDGIGKATAFELARRGARVILHGRSIQKSTHTQADIARALPRACLETAVADFSSLEQVRALAHDIAMRFECLDVLIHNAGVFMPTRQLSRDGFEMTFAVNHLAPFVLTCELLPLLRAGNARVITVSSGAHNRGCIHFADLNAEYHYEGYTAYAQSKLANILFANELAERERGTLTSNSLHPGVISTKLLKMAFNMSGTDVKQGAATSVYLATSPDVAHVTGVYFSDCTETPVAAQALDAAVQKRLWDVSAQLTGAFIRSSSEVV